MSGKEKNLIYRTLLESPKVQAVCLTRKRFGWSPSGKLMAGKQAEQLIAKKKKAHVVCLDRRAQPLSRSDPATLKEYAFWYAQNEKLVKLLTSYHDQAAFFGDLGLPLKDFVLLSMLSSTHSFRVKNEDSTLGRSIIESKLTGQNSRILGQLADDNHSLMELMRSEDICPPPDPFSLGAAELEPVARLFSDFADMALSLELYPSAIRRMMGVSRGKILVAFSIFSLDKLGDAFLDNLAKGVRTDTPPEPETWEAFRSRLEGTDRAALERVLGE